jgi:cytochrome d ubiquinol oxidase subunit II
MSFQFAWFALLCVLFCGFFLLEGFDFGVGILMPTLGRGVDTRRRVVLNTIGPVWDGNEVWIITAVGAMLAAFPDWYASLFSGMYPIILAVLLSMILRICAIEYRGKIDDPRWRARADLGIGIGSWIPAFGWGMLFANMLRGVPMGARGHVHATVPNLLSPYALLGGLATLLLFALHGAVFLALKTADEVRADAVHLAKLLVFPAAFVVLGFALVTQLNYGKGWTWALFAVIALALLVASAAASSARDGWAFLATSVAVVALVVVMFATLYPNVLPSTTSSAFNLTVYNASSTSHTLKVLTVAALIMTPLVLIYQAWTYWVFRQRISTNQIPAPIGLPARKW